MKMKITDQKESRTFIKVPCVKLHLKATALTTTATSSGNARSVEVEGREKIVMAAKPACAKDRGKLSVNLISEICKTKIFYNCSHTVTHTHTECPDTTSGWH